MRCPSSMSDQYRCPPISELITREWLCEVISTRDADLRGHRIALTYSKLAIHLDQIIFRTRSVRSRLASRQQVDSCDANWFLFATWGTVTVTRNIANQRLPQRIDTMFPDGFRRWLTPMILHERAANGQRVSRALAWAQRQIFVTSAFAMLDFIDRASALALGAPYDPTFAISDSTKAEIGELLSYENADDESVTYLKDKRHLEPIASAFQYYWKAMSARENPVLQSRYVLAGNVLLTAIEQDLANRAVGIVVDHVPELVQARTDRQVARLVEVTTGLPRQVVGLQLPFRYLSARRALVTAWVAAHDRPDLRDGPPDRDLAPRTRHSSARPGHAPLPPSAPTCRHGTPTSRSGSVPRTPCARSSKRRCATCATWFGASRAEPPPGGARPRRTGDATTTG